jgi:hypothetical protein
MEGSPGADHPRNVDENLQFNRPTVGDSIPSVELAISSSTKNISNESNCFGVRYLRLVQVQMDWWFWPSGIQKQRISNMTGTMTMRLT